MWGICFHSGFNAGIVGEHLPATRRLVGYADECVPRLSGPNVDFEAGLKSKPFFGDKPMKEIARFLKPSSNPGPSCFCAPPML